MTKRGKIILKKGLLMAETPSTAVRARVVLNDGPYAADDDTLDWDVPPISISAASTRIRVRIRDAEPEPMLDA